MVNFIWSLLFIFLGQYVKGEIKRVDFRRREDLTNVMFSYNPILFSQTTPTYKCIEHCLYIDNCVTLVSSGDGDNGECYLYDKQTADMTNQVAGVSTHVFNKVSDSSNDVTCLIRQTSLQPITPTTSTSTTPPPTTSTSTTPTTTPVPTYLRHYSGTLTWSGARQACQAQGGDLAMLDTPEEIKTVEDTVIAFTNRRACIDHTPVVCGYTVLAGTRGPVLATSNYVLSILSVSQGIQTHDTELRYYVWTGFYQSASNAAFTWVDGRVLSGVNWKPGHPVYGDMCGMVAIYGVVYFKTADCTGLTDYICELPVV